MLDVVSYCQSVASSGYRVAEVNFQNCVCAVENALNDLSVFFAYASQAVFVPFTVFQLHFFPEDSLVFCIGSVVLNIIVLVGALIWSCFNGSKDTINFLCENAGAFCVMGIQALSLLDHSIDAPGSDHRLPLLTATLASNSYAVHSLIEYCQATIDGDHNVNSSGDTAFLVAAKEGDRKMVEYFVDNHPSMIEDTNALGMSALHIALACHHFDIALHLIENCPVLVNKAGRYGMTPLHQAVLLVRRDIVNRTIAAKISHVLLHEALVKYAYIAPLDRNKVEQLFRTAAERELRGELQEHLDPLLDQASVRTIIDFFDRRDFISLVSIHVDDARARNLIDRYLSLYKLMEPLQELRQCSEVLSTRDRDVIHKVFSRDARSYRESWIEQAVEHFQQESAAMVAEVIRSGVDANIHDELDAFIRSLAVGERHEFLQQIARSPQARAVQEMRRKIHCLAEFQLTIIESLADHEANGYLVSQAGENAVHLAIKEANTPVVSFLASRFPESLENSDHTGCHPFQYCLDQGDYPSNGFNRADMDMFRTLATIAAQCRRALLDSKDRHDYTVLSKMVLEGQFENIQWLVGSGASLDVLLPWGESLMHLAVLQSWEIFDYLKERGAELDHVDQSGQTPFYRACIRAFQPENDQDAMQIVTSLRDSHQVNLNQKDAKGSSILYTLIQQNSLLGTQFLLEAGADVAGEQGPCGETLMHIAAKNGSLEFMRLLCEHGATVDEPDEKGRTPLYYAALRAYTHGQTNAQAHQMVEFLLEKHASPDTFLEGGHTLLSSLLSKGINRDGLQAFIEAEVNLAPVLPAESTLMHKAVQKCDLPVVELLMTSLEQQGHQAVIDQPNDDEWAPIYFAAKRAFGGAQIDPEARQIVNLLATSLNVNLNRRYSAGRCLLYDLLGSKFHPDGIRLLCEKGAEPAPNGLPEGVSLLHPAAAYGSLELVRFLHEEQNIPVETADKEDSPLYEAAACAFSGRLDQREEEAFLIINYLLEQGADKAKAVRELKRKKSFTIGDAFERYRRPDEQ